MIKEKVKYETKYKYELDKNKTLNNQQKVLKRELESIKDSLLRGTGTNKQNM